MNHFSFYFRLILCFGVFISIISNFSCRKQSITEPKHLFALQINNEYNLLQARYAAFLSDADGVVKVFRWLNGNDSTMLTVADTASLLSLSLVKITSVESVGGLDTLVEITTYGTVNNHDVIVLSATTNKKVIDLRLQLTNLNSLDTIVVPEGLTFVKPQLSNNYFGHYRIAHTGSVWMRARFDNDPHWRYMLFNNISDPALTVTFDKNLLPFIQAPPVAVGLPFYTTWRYLVQGVIDIDTENLLPLGDLDRVPGGAVPVLGQLNIFKPDVLPFTGYRISLEGEQSGQDGFTYYHDCLYENLPGAVPEADFDVQSTTLSDQRLIAVNCLGDFDVLTITRKNTGSPSITWKAMAEPVKNGVITNRLPDIPTELLAQFPQLTNYNFSQSTSVRADKYVAYSGMREVLQKMLTSSDPLWRAKGQLTSIEKTF